MEHSTISDVLVSDVSTSLARAHLSQRRSNSSSKRSGFSAAHMSRIEKSSSRHTSPKKAEKLNSKIAVASRHGSTIYDAIPRQSNYSINPRQITTVRTRPERPFSWHPSSHTSHETSLVSPFTMPITTTDSSSWQQSSYDWPSDIQQRHSQAASYNQTKPSTPEPLVLTYNDPRSEISQFDNSLESYPLWFHQPPRDPTSTSGFSFTGSETQDHSQSLYRLSSDLSYAYPPAANHEDSYFNSQTHQIYPPAYGTSQLQQTLDLPSASNKVYDFPKEEEVLVGLGLYDKAEDVSPTQLFSRQTFALPLNGVVVGFPGKGLKLEETWQPPPDWTSNGSPEESEASASPEDHDQRYLLFEQNPAAIPRRPQQYPLDLSAQNFFFENEDVFSVDWFPEIANYKSLSGQPADLGGYGWLDGQFNVPYV